MLLFLMASMAVEAAEIRRITRPYAVGDSEILELRLPVGAVELIPYDGKSIEVDMVLDCIGSLYGCRDSAKELRLSSELLENRVVLELRWPRELS